MFLASLRPNRAHPLCLVGDLAAQSGPGGTSNQGSLPQLNRVWLGPTFGHWRHLSARYHVRGPCSPPIPFSLAQ